MLAKVGFAHKWYMRHPPIRFLLEQAIKDRALRGLSRGMCVIGGGSCFSSATSTECSNGLLRPIYMLPSPVYFAVRDLRVYADCLGGTVKHYRDNAGLECDAVVHLEDGRWGGIVLQGWNYKNMLIALR